MKFAILCLFSFLRFIQSETSLFEYVNHTKNWNIQPFSPIVNTIKLAKKYGINIYRVKSDYAAKHRLLGGYRSGLNVIVLYNVPELEYFNKLNEETLKHELIHAIQYCKGNKSTFEPLIDFKFLLNCIVKQKINVTFIGSFYSKDDFEIELEAYCFEKFISYTDIDLLLNAFCL
jgi:hypothetical protein